MGAHFQTGGHAGPKAWSWWLGFALTLPSSPSCSPSSSTLFPSAFAKGTLAVSPLLSSMNDFTAGALKFGESLLDSPLGVEGSEEDSPRQKEDLPPVVASALRLSDDEFHNEDKQWKFQNWFSLFTQTDYWKASLHALRDWLLVLLGTWKNSERNGNRMVEKIFRQFQAELTAWRCSKPKRLRGSPHCSASSTSSCADKYANKQCHTR